MQRLIALISEITEAYRESVTVRDVAALAARRLAELFHGASVIVFEREAGRDTVRAVAGSNVPATWQMRAVHLAEVPHLAKALRQPRGLVHGAVVNNGQHEPDRSLALICGAVPDAVEPLYALMFLAPADPAEDAVRAAAIETVRHLLGTAATLANGSAERARTLAAIHHAKVEWQQTADTIPEVVGLLDRRGHIVRVSRALSRSGFGEVRAAIGRNLHAVLHPECVDGGCALKGAIGSAWRELATSPAASFECSDATLKRDLIFEFRPATLGFDHVPAERLHRVAFVITDVSSLRRAERDLTALNRTLEQRVEERTAEITSTNRALREEVARRGEAERSLRVSQIELEGVSEQLMLAQEEERKRIALDLDASVGQSLSAVKYSLERAQVLARRQQMKEIGDVVESTVHRVQSVLDEIRGISMNLRPALLDDLGAVSAIRWLCREWHDVYRDIAIDIDLEVSDADIPAVLGTYVFRAVQESLGHVARQSSARRVRVGMRLVDGILAVGIADDGSDFEPSGEAHGPVGRTAMSGLRGLRERAERSGGRCEFTSSPGAGTEICLEWPVTAGVAARAASRAVN